MEIAGFVQRFPRGIITEDPSKILRESLCLPLALYHLAFRIHLEDKKTIAESLIIEIKAKKQLIIDEQKDDEERQNQLFELSKNYTIILNDISYSRGTKKDRIWEFDREALVKLFSLESELFELSGQNPNNRPLRGTLMLQISNFLLKSRNEYNRDYICKYVPEEVASRSFYNHQIWMRKVENLNDDAEGCVIRKLFQDRTWIHVPWVGNIKLHSNRTYYISSYSKSIDNEVARNRYGSLVFGYKEDRIADLIAPIYMKPYNQGDSETGEHELRQYPIMSFVTTYDVLYDTDLLKEELNYLFGIIDLFLTDEDEKNTFLDEILQYWLYSAKESKWEPEKERRYVLFLYAGYKYIEITTGDWLKEKTTLYLYPDFILGNFPEKPRIELQLEKKRESISNKRRILCQDCFDTEYDLAIWDRNIHECPICKSPRIKKI